MAKFFDSTYKTQLLSRTNIVEIIQGRITLTKAGKNYQACCPFHQEKTPSFTVSEEKQFFYCFGCGESGNAIDFMMQYDNLSFVESIEHLAQKVGLPLPRNTEVVRPKFALDPYELIEQCCQFYSQQLEDNAQARQYIKKRQLNAQTVKQFRIGYAIDSWDQLFHHFGNDQQKIDVLSKLGMIVDHRDERQNKRYDRFRKRLMFPIIDRRGRPIAFGARVIDAQDQPKYLNNAETTIFQKRREIYGLYQCLQAERNPPYLIVTEGYMDVVALHQAGVACAVASMGTALAIEQIIQLFRHTKRIMICFDGDAAGKQAAERALKMILPNIQEEWVIKFLLLPEGVDPDNYIKQHGKINFLNFLESSLGAIEFIKVALTQHGDKNNPEHKPRLAKEAKQWISLCAKNTWRGTLLDSLSRYLDIDSQYLNDNSTHSVTKLESPSSWRKTNSRYAQQLKLSERFLIYVLSCPESITQLESVEIAILSRLSPLINQLIQVIKSSDLAELPMGIIIENWQGTADYDTLKHYLVWQSPLNKTQMMEEIKHIITTLKEKNNQEEWQELQQKMCLYGESALTKEEKKRYLELIYQRQKQQ